MGETTGIAWTGSTSDCWHGCEKVSQGCKHCYAEMSTPVRVKRAAGLELWGNLAGRSETKSWQADLRKWNRAAAATGETHRVFCQSLSDTFEDYAGSGVRRANGTTDATLDALRVCYLGVIGECSALTFQLLTKRPENIMRMVPASWLTSWPAHVWIGCTVEDQENAERRIPHLLSVPAPVRFLSVEPQIGPVDLSDLIRHDGLPGESHFDALGCDVSPEDDEWHGASIAWVICGGESGSKARPFDLAWARSLRDQCRAAGVPFFLKQLGARSVEPGPVFGTSMPVYLDDSHGGDESEWPEDLRGCRAFPT